MLANSVSRHICEVEKAGLGHALAILMNDSDFAISRGFHFHETSHMRSFAKIKHSRKSLNLHYF